MDKGKKYIIGIDPDVDGSGYCLLVDGKISLLENFQLWDIFGIIESMTRGNRDYVVIIEQSKSNNTWHKGGKGAAVNVGRNKEIANQIVKFCEQYKIPHRTIEPQGYSSVSHKSFNAIMKTDFKQTNPEKRVAGLFAYNSWRGLI